MLRRRVNREGRAHDKLSYHWRGKHYRLRTRGRVIANYLRIEMRVLVVDKNKKPLMPCQPARARKLLRYGKAAVYRQYPFTIILKASSGGNTQAVSIKFDPGSQTTGIAMVADFKTGSTCIWGANLKHRGSHIKALIDARRAVRHNRRNRKTRHRQPRFLNRTRPSDWLPPSIMSRVHNVETWAKKLIQFAPVTEAHIETVRFDMQLMENPDIQGIEYQQGTLMGWEIREYLLYRHNHTCAYCNATSGDPILEKEHIHPRSLNGTNRLKNLVIACRTCNLAKGNLRLDDWLKDLEEKKDKLSKARVAGVKKVASGLLPTLKDAAAVNSTRNAVAKTVKALLPTQLWSGGRTKKTAVSNGTPKIIGWMRPVLERTAVRLGWNLSKF